MLGQNLGGGRPPSVFSMSTKCSQDPYLEDICQLQPQLTDTFTFKFRLSLEQVRSQEGILVRSNVVKLLETISYQNKWPLKIVRQILED